MQNRGLPHVYLSACKLWQVFLKACPQPTAHGSEAAWTSNSQALHSWFSKGQKPNVISRVCIAIVLWNGPWFPIAHVPLDKGNADSRNKINPCACMDMHWVWVFIDHYKDWNDSAKGCNPFDLSKSRFCDPKSDFLFHQGLNQSKTTICTIHFHTWIVQIGISIRFQIFIPLNETAFRLQDRAHSLINMVGSRLVRAKVIYTPSLFYAVKGL